MIANTRKPNFSAFIRRLEKLRSRIAADRDALSELVNEADALLESATEAEESLRAVIDKLSEYA